MRRSTRICAVFACAVALLLAATACGGDEDAVVQLPDNPDITRSTNTTTTESTILTETETETSTGTAITVQTQPGATIQITVPPVSKTAATQSTTKTSTAKTTTTTAKSKPTVHYDNPIAVANQDQALTAFHDAINIALSRKAGFAKTHSVTYKNWKYDPSITDGFPQVPLLGDITDVMSAALNTALNKGVQTAEVVKGDSHALLRKSSWTMSDLKKVTYSADGSDWIVTVEVKDGETRQVKKLLSSGITGNSPIDKGPLHLATGDGELYDHMTADRVF
ncbi:MAG: hypothetical protein LBB67_06730, partial [Oscillospiraceae bacterium]|nr:hypothetical protein [Oscillospiraceae bacterium]